MAMASIRILFLAALAAIAGVMGWGQAHAQDTARGKPLRIIVGFAPGGAADISARVLATKLGESLGQNVIVENRTGGGGNIATEAVARAEPDGTTLLMAPLSNAVNETLAAKTLQAKFGTDLIAVAPVSQTAHILVTHPSLGVNTVADLIALAKSKPPGELLSATSGRGASTHLAIEMFNIMAGVKIAPVHYRGGAELTKDLLSGEVKLTFASIAPILQYVKAGTLRGVATTGLKRDSVLPDTPTIAESGLPGYEVLVWFGLLTTAGTPRPMVDRIAAATAEALKQPEVKNAFATLGFEPLAGTPDEFTAFYRNEVEKWRKVIETAGLTNE
jgi:tripartite-type tricarboxylate transporter receptor subunit TctC